jgi:hypothetical protein
LNAGGLGGIRVLESQWYQDRQWLLYLWSLWSTSIERLEWKAYLFKYKSTNAISGIRKRIKRCYDNGLKMVDPPQSEGQEVFLEEVTSKLRSEE